ncbi:hypothetical protein AJ80_01661 [Polytolypa hystricis UAMH7299]|uniref:SET domain-containing protein n=1 Tax=Polytolypa hystricis (strain UAMH7299) TaxID=1447883 RepID=A0A2B7YZF3_POLH7|nr:hypothetical protein AJ80_01661 [Polytolypa hystricis UAMH7299]
MVKGIRSAGPKHEEFTKWTKSQNIKINGVAAARFPGKGVGIVALRDINAGEVVVSVPRSSMLSIEKIPKEFQEKFPKDIAVLALFAAYLCCGGEFKQTYPLWRAVWPTHEDFEEYLPILWLEQLRALLPPAASGKWSTLTKRQPGSPEYDSDPQNILPKQQEKLEKGFHAVKQVFPEVSFEEYSYYWLASNTRCFYYVPAGAKPPKDRNDAMALCPFADYFNHTDEGVSCKVLYDDYEYSFQADRSYDKGEELFVSYGNHTNDVLLTEYGFVPEQNKWDAIFLDDVILKDLSGENLQDLEWERYLGNYQITDSGPCFRTEMAACIKYMPAEDWARYAAGDQPQSFSQKKTNAIISGWIREYVKEANHAILELTKILEEGGGSSVDSRAQTILRRWRQILALCNTVLESLN